MSDPTKILIVDDDEMVLCSIEDILDDDYQVRATLSANEAVEILKKESFNLLLTDLMMEEMHGTDLIQEAIKIQPNITCIVLTGLREKKAAATAAERGAFTLLEKPLMPSTVRDTVLKALQKN